MRRISSLLPLSFILGAACGNVDQGAELDGIDDDLPAGGKADTGTLAENTPDAYAVLQVANRVDEKTLKSKVGLGAQAAGAIISTRIGDDGVWKTRDDVTFANLSDLDQVAWVGPKAFERLRDWGKKNGYGMPDLYGLYVVSLMPVGGADVVDFYVQAHMEPSGKFADKFIFWTDDEHSITMYGNNSHADFDRVSFGTLVPGGFSKLGIYEVSLSGAILSGDLLCGYGTIQDSNGRPTQVTWGATRYKETDESIDPLAACR